MIETCRLKNVLIFFQTILRFVLSRKIIKFYNDIARKYGNVTVKYFRKYEKLEYKKNKMRLDIDFLNNCKQLGVYRKFLNFKLTNVSNKDALSIRKRLPRSAMNKRKKKESVCPKTFYLRQLSTIDFYILTKSITSHNKKSLQKSLYTQQKKLSSLKGNCSLPIFRANTQLLLTSRNMDYHRKNLIYLKQVYTFQSSQIKFENLKSSLPLKRFVVRLLTILNSRKPKVR